jgi:hypothetical protein
MDFLGIPHLNLSHFRSCLVIHELEGQVSNRLTEMATEAGIVDPDKKQGIDSSHIFGEATVQDTYELLQDQDGMWKPSEYVLTTGRDGAGEDLGGSP